MSSSSQIAEIEKSLSALSQQVIGDEDARKKLLAVPQQQSWPPGISTRSRLEDDNRGEM
jgi:hypothetical protein